MITNPLRIDNSMLEAWESCPRKFYYRYVLDRAGAATPALSFGQAVHTCLYELKRNGIDAALAKTATVEIVQDDNRNKARLFELIYEYAKRYSNDYIVPLTTSDGTPLLELQGEHTFKLPNGEDFTYFGRIDLIGTERDDDSPVIVDYKTCSRDLEGPSVDTFFHKWSLSSQMMGYWFLVKKLGITPRGVLIDGIGNTTKKITFCRRLISFRQDQLAEWEENLKVKVSQIAEMVNKQQFAMHTSSCFNFNSKCSFFDICSSPTHIRGKLLESLPIDVWNE